MTKYYYCLLDIKEDATQEDIKKSYKKLAIQYHPDKTGGDKDKENKFKEIVVAYNILKDENKRRNYDMFGDGYDDINIDDLFTEYNNFNDLFYTFLSDDDNIIGRLFSNITHFTDENPNLISNITHAVSSGISNFQKHQQQQDQPTQTTTAMFINTIMQNNNNFNMMDCNKEEIIDLLDGFTSSMNKVSSIYRYHNYYVSLKQIMNGDTIIIKDTKYGKYKIKIAPGIPNNYLLKKNVNLYCTDKCKHCNECQKNIKLCITIKYDLSLFNNYNIDNDGNLYIFENISIIEYFCGFTRIYNIQDKNIGLVVNNFIDMNTSNDKYDICIDNCALPIYKKQDKYTNLYIKLHINMPKIKIFNQFKNLLMKALNLKTQNIDTDIQLKENITTIWSI